MWYNVNNLFEFFFNNTISVKTQKLTFKIQVKQQSKIKMKVICVSIVKIQNTVKIQRGQRNKKKYLIPTKKLTVINAIKSLFKWKRF